MEWEYMVDYADASQFSITQLHHELNTHGANGWELVSTEVVNRLDGTIVVLIYKGQKQPISRS